MAEIEAIITRQGAVHTLKETVAVGDMKDLIASLKNIKGSTNELLTTFVQEDATKPGARATGPRDCDEEGDEEDSDEPDASEGTPQKRAKT
ncbi:hypothetical protein AND_005168 [Anopheles darlingi]|uniref:Uncharacterized protein n=1 Tax=Anopheles darlingi TaxID=43151 RepID=W5JIK9_ANODA|nr:hypothetical protein AND_005168 [Anopheles darlingi]